jgi:hypothetical protein
VSAFVLALGIALLVGAIAIRRTIKGKSEVTETPIVDLASIIFDPPLETIIADAALAIALQPDDVAVRAVQQMRAGLQGAVPDCAGKSGLIESCVIEMLQKRSDIQNACGIPSSALH